MKHSKTMLFQVDAFTDKPFAGNPAAVCLLEQPRDAVWMQSVANEMNLSETAFVRPLDKGFELRWFTPLMEVDLCGHATLAAAHILWDQGCLSKGEEAHFQTRSGCLTVRQENHRYVLDFPVVPVTDIKAPPGLFRALDIQTGNIFFNQADYLVQLADEAEVRGIQPDFRALAKIKARGVIVTAKSTQPTYDFMSRFFAPACGIDEDPVTGSAHCTLAPFWAQRLGKQMMRAFQASGRSGELLVELRDDRVLLTGQAVTVFRGELYV